MLVFRLKIREVEVEFECGDKLGGGVIHTENVSDEVLNICARFGWNFAFDLERES